MPVKESNQNKNGGSENLPAWDDCELFCIHDYAGNASRCGWRGRLTDVRHDPGSGSIRCPRCGCADLLRIPSTGNDQQGV